MNKSPYELSQDNMQRHLSVERSTDLARTLAEIAASPVPPVKREPAPYDGWHEIDWDGLVLQVPYWWQNKHDFRTDAPDIKVGQPDAWKLIRINDQVRKGAENVIADQLEADDYARRVDRACDERDDR